MSITPEQLAEWQRLCESATPGPWFVNERTGIVCHGDPADDRDNYPIDNPEDWDFTAAARVGWPATMDALEAARRSEAAAWQDAEIQGGVVTTMTTYVAMLEVERDRLAAELGEWVRAANLAFRGNPQSEQERAENERRGIDILTEMAAGSSWANMPPCALELAVRERDRLAARVAELEGRS